MLNRSRREATGRPAGVRSSTSCARKIDGGSISKRCGKWHLINSGAKYLERVAKPERGGMMARHESVIPCLRRPQRIAVAEQR